MAGNGYPRWFDRPSTDDRALARLHQQLEREAAPLLLCIDRGMPMDTFDRLTVEAFDLARAGDIDGAKHRLRLRDYPKWDSVADCRNAYDAHMAAQRAAQQNGNPQ